LYDCRREERLRAARAWFSEKFHPQTMDELQTLCPPGSAENASLRMVVSHWDMVASFITSGVLNPDLFFESGRELLQCWMQIEAFVPPLRALFGEPMMFHNLEKVAKQYADWLNARAPGSYEAFAAAIRKMR